MSKKERPMSFRSIRGHRSGECCLTIYPPGTFMNNADYSVHVGGCRVGHAATLSGAKGILLSEAVKYCQQQIDESEAKRMHYVRELNALQADGLRAPDRPKNARVTAGRNPDARRREIR
jgi:hypothetical protein